MAHIKESIGSQPPCAPVYVSVSFHQMSITQGDTHKSKIIIFQDLGNPMFLSESPYNAHSHLPLMLPELTCTENPTLILPCDWPLWPNIRFMSLLLYDVTFHSLSPVISMLLKYTEKMISVLDAQKLARLPTLIPVSVAVTMWTFMYLTVQNLCLLQDLVWTCGVSDCSLV